MDLSYRHSRHLIAPDLRLVRDAAVLLRLCEFDVFHASWRNWFGQSPDEKVLDRFFVDYLFHQRVPFWVRHFAKRVIRDAEDGRIDRRELGVTDYQTRRPIPEFGRTYLAVTYAAALVIYLFLTYSAG